MIVLFKAKFAENDCKAMAGKFRFQFGFQPSYPIILTFWSLLLTKRPPPDAIYSLVQSTQPNSIVAFQLEDVSEKTVKDLKIECIPSVLLFANSKPVDRVQGPDVAELLPKIKESILKHYPLVANIDSSDSSSLDARLKALINSAGKFPRFG